MDSLSLTILGARGGEINGFLDIRPCAAQLAELALVFKAREKSRRFFQPEHLVRPNIIELREVSFDEADFSMLGVQLLAIHPELNRATNARKPRILAHLFNRA